MYFTAHENSQYRFQTSRLGDVIATRLIDGKEVYFQPGDAGSTILDVLEENPPEHALDIFINDYFA